MSTSFAGEEKPLEASEDSEVDEEDGRGLSVGEMSAEEVGVESVVVSRRRTAWCGKAVVDIADRVESDRKDVAGTGRVLPSKMYGR